MMEGEEDEIPLLEGMSTQFILNQFLDLGIDIEKIKAKFMSILTQRGIKENADHDDLAGPVLVCVMFGILLLFVRSLCLSILERKSSIWLHLRFRALWMPRNLLHH
jgi:hypothetical protein